MRLTKRQLKRIIREEYSRLKRRGLIKESWDDESIGQYANAMSTAYGQSSQDDTFKVEDASDILSLLNDPNRSGITAHDLQDKNPNVDVYELVMSLEDQRKVYLHDDGTLELL